MDGVGGAEGEAVEAVAGVVSVEGKVAVKVQLADFVLEDPDLQLFGMPPELPVEVEAGAVMAGAVGITGGVADRVEEDLVAAGQLRPGDQLSEKPHGGQRAGDLVPVNAGEDTKPMVRVAAFRTEKTETGKKVRLGKMVPVDELVGAEMA